VKLLADLKRRRARIDRAIAVLERIRDARGERLSPPNAGRRRRQPTAKQRPAAAKPAEIIPFGLQARAQNVAGSRSIN
jgi:hypothetical protein